MTAIREPWLAALLGLTFPGAGHVYAGVGATGAVLAVAGLALLAFTVSQVFGPAGSVVLGAAGFALFLLLCALSAVDAHRRVVRAASPEFEAARRASRDAWKAVCLSAIFPGLGQVAAGRMLAGNVFLALGGAALLTKAWPLALAQALVRGAAMLEAWSGGESRRGSAPTTARNVVLALALLQAGQLTLTAWVRGHVVRAYRLPSESMLPTLRVGDFVFADLRAPERVEAGDLVVFRYPPDPSKDFIERCVATAGQRVVIRDKEVFVDGVRLAEPYVRHIDAYTWPAERGPRDNMPVFTVPPGSYFVLGDNRDNSYDSRFWGPVAEDLVRGRVYKIYWPLDRAGPLRRR